MKLLKEIPTKFFVGVDIETVRIAEDFGDLSDAWQSAWEYKNKQDGVVPDFDELAKLWKKNASLYAEFAKVCAVSLTFLDVTETKLMCKEFFGENEDELLFNLAEFLNRISSKNSNFRLVGHAAKYFDYPFLSKRYVINGIDIPQILDTAHLKPWESKNLCTNQDIWKMGGTGAGSSLQALCTALDIPISKVDLVGDEVGGAYYRGELKRIASYCSLDTIATFNIIRKIKKESIFSFDEVVYLDKEAVAEVSEVPLLERIMNSPQITTEDKQELTDLLKKKKVLKKDRPILEEILVRLYVNNEMFKADKADVAERKANEIKEILNSL